MFIVTSDGYEREQKGGRYRARGRRKIKLGTIDCGLSLKSVESP